MSLMIFLFFKQHFNDTPSQFKSLQKPIKINIYLMIKINIYLMHG